MKSIGFTQEGFENLKKEQEDLQEQRKKTLIDLKAARDMGDLSENGFYKATKSRMGEIDRRLRELKYLINTAKVFSDSKNENIQIGATVLLISENEEVEYKIVGEYEADSLNGKISIRSPLGKILLNKKINDIVILQLPRSAKEYKILKIS